MGIWNELENLPDEYKKVQLPEIYIKRNFSFEIRCIFPDWFENQNWNFDETDPSNRLADELLMTLIGMIEEYSAKPQNLIDQMRFHQVKKTFLDTFGDKPQIFVKTVRQVLEDEQQLLNSMRMSTMTVDQSQEYVEPIEIEQPPCTDMNKGMLDLEKMIVELDLLIKDVKEKQETLMLKYTESQHLQNEVTSLLQQPSSVARNQKVHRIQKRKEEIEKDLKELASHLCNDSNNKLLFILKTILDFISNLMGMLAYQLMVWRTLQQRSLSGGQEPSSLDELQKWFEQIFEKVWHFFSNVNQSRIIFEALNMKPSLEQVKIINDNTIKFIREIISRSFLVEKQPPQVLKTQTKFQATVRLLVGSKLSIQMSCPEVSVSILSEKQCKDFITTNKLEDITSSGDIVNNKCVMELSSDRTTFKAEFKNLQLKKIKRQDRKGQESVLEAKSALLFHAKLNMSGQDMPVVCMSLPVVVVVHGNQGPNSEATIFWDNMFSKPERQAFEVPEEVSWKEMKVALNDRWRLTAEHKLHEEHLLFLKEKLFSNNPQEVDNPNAKVSWAVFNKEHIAQRSFTFWEWFYGAIDVVKKHLKDHWNDQCLEFMSRQSAHVKLLEKPGGTFLIRFSDGEPGAVTIAWCRETPERKDVFFVQPWKAKDFAIKELADRIFDIPEIVYLYPDIPKDQAFGRYRNYISSSDATGYVRTEIVTKMVMPSQGPQSSVSHYIDQVLQSPENYHGVLNEASLSSPVADFPSSTAPFSPATSEISLPGVHSNFNESFTQQMNTNEFDINNFIDHAPPGSYNNPYMAANEFSNFQNTSNSSFSNQY